MGSVPVSDAFSFAGRILRAICTFKHGLLRALIEVRGAESDGHTRSWLVWVAEPFSLLFVCAQFDHPSCTTTARNAMDGHELKSDQGVSWGRMRVCFSDYPRLEIDGQPQLPQPCQRARVERTDALLHARRHLADFQRSRGQAKDYTEQPVLMPEPMQDHGHFSRVLHVHNVPAGLIALQLMPLLQIYGSIINFEVSHCASSHRAAKKPSPLRALTA